MMHQIQVHSLFFYYNFPICRQSNMTGERSGLGQDQRWYKVLDKERGCDTANFPIPGCQWTFLTIKIRVCSRTLHWYQVSVRYNKKILSETSFFNRLKILNLCCNRCHAVASIFHCLHDSCSKKLSDKVSLHSFNLPPSGPIHLLGPLFFLYYRRSY